MEKRAYDNREVKEGEVLVPMLATEERIQQLKADRSNLKTWVFGGYSYKVMFYPIPADFEKMAMSQFYYDIEEQRGLDRHKKYMCHLEDLTHETPSYIEDDTALLYDDLIAHLNRIDKRSARVVALGMSTGSDGRTLGCGDRRELVKLVMAEFNVKEKQAYNIVNACLLLVKKFFCK